MKELFGLLHESLALWFERDGESMAAAVSYYAMFAIVPLIFISVYFVSLLYGRELVTEIMLSWGSTMGTGVLMLLQGAVSELPHSPVLLLTPLASFLFLVFAVLILFNTLTEGFHKLWLVSSSGISDMLRKSGRALVCLLFLQLFIVALIAADFGFALLFEGVISRSYASTLVYILSLSILFTLFYTILPLGNRPSFKSRFYGAFIAAILFSLAKTSVSIHIALTPVPTLFGGAGIAIILLLWVYVSTSFIYYGAAFAYVHDQRKKSKLTPK